MSARTFHVDGAAPALGADQPIFVFGSNVPGWHGKGAAKFAAERLGAKRGVGEGPMGQCYGIPTKGKSHPLGQSLKTLPIETIAENVDRFVQYATEHPEKRFMVTRIGCVLAGFSNEEIAPLFKAAPANCSFAGEWAPYLDAETEVPRARGSIQGSAS